MLSYKISEILLAGGKEYPYKWLVNYCGFSRNKAYKILKMEIKSITLVDLAKLCEGLHCTPNDLMYWENTPRLTLPPGHPLLALTPPSKKSDWHKLFKTIEPNKLIELHRKLEQGEI